MTAEVESDEGFKPAEEGATDEDGGSSGGGGGERSESVDLVVF